jgi:hypothetical protein
MGHHRDRDGHLLTSKITSSSGVGGDRHDKHHHHHDRGSGGKEGLVGADGVALKIVTGEEEEEEDEDGEHGDEYPSVSTIKNEFKRMIISLKDVNNNDRGGAVHIELSCTN